MRHVLLGLAVTASLLAGCKGDVKRCELAARNFAELVYKDKMEKELEAAPADKRESMRKEKLADYANEVEDNIDFFVRQCVAANNDEQVECMIAAKDAKAAKKCADLAKPD